MLVTWYDRTNLINSLSEDIFASSWRTKSHVQSLKIAQNIPCDHLKLPWRIFRIQLSTFFSYLYVFHTAETHSRWLNTGFRNFSKYFDDTEYKLQYNIHYKDRIGSWRFLHNMWFSFKLPPYQSMIIKMKPSFAMPRYMYTKFKVLGVILKVLTQPKLQKIKALSFGIFYAKMTNFRH
jgi:hypothetical protein